MPRMTPEQLYNEYRKGFSGCLWEQHVFDELIETSKYAYFTDGAKRIKDSGKGKLSTPYKSVLKFEKSAYRTRQQQGDCVSFATRNACDLTRAVEIDIKGDKESWLALGATEGIYGFRGHGGEGMSCARAANFVSKTGGILLRKNYPGIIDLSKYQPRLSKGWGSRGLPDNIINLADNHQIRTVSLIKTVEEARDALANGYGLSVCSNYGFSNRRDSKGFARKSGSWAHAMCYHPDMEILTKRGWIKVSNMNNDDIFATLNPNTHSLEWQPTKTIVEMNFTGDLYRYKKQSLDLMVTPDHRMYCIKKDRYIKNNIPENYEFINAEDTSKAMYVKLTAHNSNNAHLLYYTTSNGTKISMNVWLEFLGYFISEGCSVSFDSVRYRKDRNNNPYQRKVRRIEISQTKAENLDIIEKCLNDLPFHFRKIKNKWVCEQQELYDELCDLGKAHQKYIPDYVWDCGKDQLAILLSALMMGDGTSKNDKMLSYSTASKRLADEFQKLLLYTGFSGKVSHIPVTKKAKGSFATRDQYVINIRLFHSHITLGEPDKEFYAGKVYCPSTENGIVYVRNNGNPVWCGNCWTACDDTNGEPAFLVQNSWGKWNDGGHPEWGPIPDGSFLIHADVAEGMLRQNGAYAFSDFNGFPPQKLPDYGFVDYL